MHQRSNFFSRTPDMAFPGAAAYALLVLTNLVYNSFGGEAGGIQFFYASPVTFPSDRAGEKSDPRQHSRRQHRLRLDRGHSTSMARPHLAVTVATLAGLLFAAPLNFTAGNLLSIYSPKKRDFSTFGRQNVSQTTVLASFGVQIVIVGSALRRSPSRGSTRISGSRRCSFLCLAAISIPLY